MSKWKRFDKKEPTKLKDVLFKFVENDDQFIVQGFLSETGEVYIYHDIQHVERSDNQLPDFWHDIPQ